MSAFPAPPAALLNRICENAYRRYHRREYLHPDPLEIVHEYPDPRDREVVALIASSLALGQVKSILKATREVLRTIPSPYRDLRGVSREEMSRRLPGFVYRFFGTDRISSFLAAIGSLLEDYGSIQEAFLEDYRSSHETVLPALTSLAYRLSHRAGGEHGILISFPDKGSASKRLHLFLRWMVRRDELDFGDWSAIDPAKLIVPVDTHMLRIARYLGMTDRKTADRRAAEEVSAAFREINPSDPARYDFALTRAGIHPELAPQELGDVLGRVPAELRAKELPT